MSTTLIDINEKLGQKRFMITIHQSLPREAFWHEYAKIPRVVCKKTL